MDSLLMRAHNPQERRRHCPFSIFHIHVRDHALSQNFISFVRVHGLRAALRDNLAPLTIKHCSYEWEVPTPYIGPHVEVLLHATDSWAPRSYIFVYVFDYSSYFPLISIWSALSSFLQTKQQMHYHSLSIGNDVGDSAVPSPSDAISDQGGSLGRCAPLISLRDSWESTESIPAPWFRREDYSHVCYCSHAAHILAISYSFEDICFPPFTHQ